MTRPALALGLLPVLVLAACGGSSSIPAKDLGGRVLQASDLGAPFASFNSGPQTRLDNQGTPRADPGRFGREGGWIARFHRPGSPRTAGPLVVESRVDVFRGESGAKADLDLYRTMLEGQPGARSLPPPDVGDAAVAVTFLQAGGLSLRFYRIAWRYRNATASVLVQGFDGKVRETDALALARKQQERLSHS